MQSFALSILLVSNALLCGYCAPIPGGSANSSGAHHERQDLNIPLGHSQDSPRETSAEARRYHILFPLQPSVEPLRSDVESLAASKLNPPTPRSHHRSKFMGRDRREGKEEVMQVESSSSTSGEEDDLQNRPLVLGQPSSQVNTGTGHGLLIYHGKSGKRKGEHLNRTEDKIAKIDLNGLATTSKDDDDVVPAARRFDFSQHPDWEELEDLPAHHRRHVAKYFISKRRFETLMKSETERHLDAIHKHYTSNRALTPKLDLMSHQLVDRMTQLHSHTLDRMQKLIRDASSPRQVQSHGFLQPLQLQQRLGDIPGETGLPNVHRDEVNRSQADGMTSAHHHFHLIQSPSGMLQLHPHQTHHQQLLGSQFSSPPPQADVVPPNFGIHHRTSGGVLGRIALNPEQARQVGHMHATGTPAHPQSSATGASHVMAGSSQDMSPNPSQSQPDTKVFAKGQPLRTQQPDRTRSTPPHLLTRPIVLPRTSLQPILTATPVVISASASSPKPNQIPLTPRPFAIPYNSSASRPPASMVVSPTANQINQSVQTYFHQRGSSDNAGKSGNNDALLPPPPGFQRHEQG